VQEQGNFGGANDFCPDFPKKKKGCISFWVHFFQIKAYQAPFLPKFLPNLPEKKTTKKLPPKMRLHFNFGCHFILNQSTSSDFAKVFIHFA